MILKSPPRRGWGRADLLVAAGLMLVVAGVLGPAIAKTRILSARERSASHLRQIGEGMQNNIGRRSASIPATADHRRKR